MPVRQDLRGTLATGLIALLVTAAAAAQAQESETGELAAAAQNPVADLISLPLQNNMFFGIGADDETANVLNIQPVLPFKVGNWNIINRTIAPLISVPDLTGGIGELPEGRDKGNAFGLGDINHTAFLSPARPGRIVWGAGPTVTVPTATNGAVGTGKASAGPSAVFLATPKPWVLGTLVRQIWSFAGDDDRPDVSQLLLQPFVNFNLDDGWYLVSSPVITANWEASGDDRWLVPLGGGAGRIFTIGAQPMNAQVQGFYNIEHPTIGPEWTLRFQLQFLFPR